MKFAKYTALKTGLPDSSMDVKRRMELFPESASLTEFDGKFELMIAGCSLDALAEEHGTPLYIYDRFTLDRSVDAYRNALEQSYPGESGITYAGKAYLCTAIAHWAHSRGLYLDCTGAGEIRTAIEAGLRKKRIVMHGVNKSLEDLQSGLDSAEILVIDNLPELEQVIRMVRGREKSSIPSFWLRLRPGVAVDTHRHTQTGQTDSKFGMSREELLAAVELCKQHHLPVNGIHFHQGSHFHNTEPLGQAIDVSLDLSIECRTLTGWIPEVLCPGGGWGVAYHENLLPHPPVLDYVEFISRRIVQGCEARGLPLPKLIVEPGRSLVARAGVALYRVGTVKKTANRKWLLLDGGLSDNPRPALYQASYSALPVHWHKDAGVAPTWLAGPHCESGDILVEGLPLPEVSAGELIAVPVSGAYQLSMSSNYNGARKPAVVLLDRGQAQLIQRRETLDDLVRRDLPLF